MAHTDPSHVDDDCVLVCIPRLCFFKWWETTYYTNWWNEVTGKWVKAASSNIRPLSTPIGKQLQLQQLCGTRYKPPLAGSSNLNFPPKQSAGWKFNTESLKSNHLKSKTVPTQNDDLLLKGSEDLATLPSGLESKSKLCLDRRFVLEICGLGFQFRFESLEKVVDGEFGIAGVFEWVHKRERNNEWNQEWQREHTARARPLMWNQSGRGFRLAVASHVRLRRCWTLTGADWWGPSLYSLMMVPQHPVPRGEKHFFFF